MTGIFHPAISIIIRRLWKSFGHVVAGFKPAYFTANVYLLHYSNRFNGSSAIVLNGMSVILFLQVNHVLVVSDIMEYTSIITYQHLRQRFDSFSFNMTLTFDHIRNDNGMWFAFRHDVDCIILTTTTLGNHCEATENHAHSGQHTLLH